MNSMDIDQTINRIIKSRTPTAVSDVQSEIETNHAYINQVQLKKLIQLHDENLQERCHIPLKKLYDKYNDKILGEGDLQNWAEHIERDLRLLETTLKIVKQEGEPENLD
ncbi:Bls1p Ecym_3245 [Eremothecium cymbalariae DBVPG|uniref:Uncharacterized protein n=1 Tax=Eremothecium cymbalariae (strain CBS 270.75 / DBVPG 7215 / KCTC 17166 / NRRL Y-17582) TaxID=931890 RepID=G8JRG9_ERECY|nr:Hypothetical protein Ecym_3245 [Eremothecium cymbalariae DBVPG\